MANKYHLISEQTTTNHPETISTSSSSSSSSSSSTSIAFANMGSLTIKTTYSSSSHESFLCKNWFQNEGIASLDEEDKSTMHALTLVRETENNGQLKLFTRGHWRPTEDAKLKELVALYGPQNWNLIAEKLQGRSGKSCRLRWFNQLDPRITRRAFSEEEEERLMEAHRLYGNKWAMIARLFPGRTDNAVKNHWHVIKARKYREQSKDFIRRKISPIVPRIVSNNEPISFLNNNPNGSLIINQNDCPFSDVVTGGAELAFLSNNGNSNIQPSNCFGIFPQEAQSSLFHGPMNNNEMVMQSFHQNYGDNTKNEFSNISYLCSHLNNNPPLMSDSSMYQHQLMSDSSMYQHQYRYAPMNLHKLSPKRGKGESECMQSYPYDNNDVVSELIQDEVQILSIASLMKQSHYYYSYISRFSNAIATAHPEVSTTTLIDEGKSTIIQCDNKIGTPFIDFLGVGAT